MIPKPIYSFSTTTTTTTTTTTHIIIIIIIIITIIIIIIIFDDFEFFQKRVNWSGDHPHYLYGMTLDGLGCNLLVFRKCQK